MPPKEAIKPYDAFGRCIYCFEQARPEESLGEEHIVPRALGGQWVIPEAACRRCERKIQRGYENYCINDLFNVPRAHLGIPGRRSGKPAAHIHQKDPNTNLPLGKVPIKDHAGMFSLFVFGPPGIYLRADPRAREAVYRLLFYSTNNEPIERVKRSGQSQTIGSFDLKGNDADRFKYFLAKIAHGYAMAEGAAQNIEFQPMLRDVVLKHPSKAPDFYVGGIDAETFSKEPGRTAGNELHSLNLGTEKIGNYTYLLVFIRLFGIHGTPTYRVVAGRLWPPPAKLV